MKRIRNIVLCACMLIGTCVHAYAQADGSTCYKAIPLGKDYSVQVTEPKSVWYTAWTYDLPLSVYFIPEHEDDPEPEVMMDFGCTPGIYGDPILCMLFCKGAPMSKEIPNYPKLSTTTVDGKFAYYLSMGKTYRDLLLQMGIDYNVQVFVKVTYNSRGDMSIAPDNMFSNCMDGAKFMHLGDTVKVQAKDAERHVVVPYVQWKTEDIIYTWTGTQPCRMIVTSDCRSNVFDDGSDEAILQIMELQPGDQFEVTRKNIKHYVDFVDNEAGMFFVKCYSEEPGELKITKKPVPPARGGATRLYYDKEQVLFANDTNALFAISEDWEEGTKFSVPTDHIFRMYIDSTPDFRLSEALFSYTFNRVDSGGHDLCLEATEMENLWKKKNKNDNYLYIRFECTARTAITATLWDPSPCTTKAKLIEKNDSIILRNPQYYTDYYRFRYVDWVGGDMTFTWWVKAAHCMVAVADSCEFEVDEADPHVHYFFTALKRTNTAVKPYVVPKEDVALWKDYVDEDGFLYLRFNSDKYAGGMTVKSDAPEETDPTYPASTIAVVCDESESIVYVRVSVAQTIVITDSNEEEVDRWEAEVGETHTINLPAGNYILQGESEKIDIKL